MDQRSPYKQDWFGGYLDRFCDQHNNHTYSFKLQGEKFVVKNEETGAVQMTAVPLNPRWNKYRAIDGDGNFLELDFPELAMYCCTLIIGIPAMKLWEHR